MAISGSIYCQAHQTPSSKANHTRRTFPLTRRGPRNRKQVTHIVTSVAGNAALTKALEDTENLDDVTIPTVGK
jgi:hypothetical protein